MNNCYIQPDWDAPKNIKAYTTLRTGGISPGPYESFNLAHHVGDNAEHVTENRRLLKENLQLPSEPIWVSQTHSTIALRATAENKAKEADATFTDEPRQVCAILTADCVPILLCHQKGTQVAVVHAGWRGLANGVIEATLRALNTDNNQILAWIGPAVSQPNYEVGEEVRDAFIKANPEAIQAFSPSPAGRWYANLSTLAKMRLTTQGVNKITGGDFCTYADKERFFSFRRDGKLSGRMASLIWID